MFPKCTGHSGAASRLSTALAWAYVSGTQINLYYSIPAGTASGTYTNDIGVTTPYGAAYANFYVD